MDIQGIQEILPHRYPFLLVDRILEMDEGVRGTGLKNITYNELQFLGHYPGNPIMPGVLLVEAMAQLGAIVILKAYKGKKIVPYLTGLDGIRFRKPVVPGDQVILEAEKIVIKGNLGKMKVSAKVDGKLAAEGEIMFALVEDKK